MGQDFSASNLRCNNSQVMPVHGENYRANVSVLSKDLRGQGIARFDVLLDAICPRQVAISRLRHKQIEMK